MLNKIKYNIILYNILQNNYDEKYFFSKIIKSGL